FVYRSDHEPRRASFSDRDYEIAHVVEARFGPFRNNGSDLFEQSMFITGDGGFRDQLQEIISCLRRRLLGKGCEEAEAKEQFFNHKIPMQKRRRSQREFKDRRKG